MNYDFFLMYVGAFISIGIIIGSILLIIAYKNRIALRSLLSPVRLRRTPTLVRPISLRGSSTSASPRS